MLRENIEKLIKSGVTAHTVSLNTGIPRNTVYRIFSGEASLDNITLKNAELLNKYYEEKVLMNGLIKKWINELQHDVIHHETLDYWVYEINSQYSRFSWYGLSYVWISKYILDNNDIYYMVEVEVVSELVKQTEDPWIIRNALLGQKHQSGDCVCVGLFKDKQRAYKFAEENYSKIDIEKELDDILGEHES